MILQIGNRTRIAAEVVGTYPFRLSLGFRLVLKDCYYVSVASQNLIFISVLVQDEFIFNFNKNFCSIYFLNKLIARGLLIDSLYHLHVDMYVNVNEQIMSVIGHKRSRDDINHKYMWYFRFDHIGEDRINKLKKDDILGLLNFESYPVCESCIQEKIIKLPFIGYRKRTTEILILVHTDVCSPFNVQVRSGYHYFITFIDDQS